MPSLETDERRTPRWFFELCDAVWGPFDLDACAAKWNAQCPRFISRQQDVFSTYWRARSVWHNPPYSRGNLSVHLHLARARVLNGTWRRCTNLIPADPSTTWWQQHVARPEGRALEAEWLHGQLPTELANATRYVSEGLITTVAFVAERLPFDGPDGPVGGDVDDRRPTGAMQPSAVVVFERPDVWTGGPR